VLPVALLSYRWLLTNCVAAGERSFSHSGKASSRLPAALLPGSAATSVAPRWVVAHAALIPSMIAPSSLRVSAFGQLAGSTGNAAGSMSEYVGLPVSVRMLFGSPAASRLWLYSASE
jgi:hypothetical protein